MRHTRRRLLVALAILVLVVGLAVYGVQQFTADPDDYARIEEGLYMGRAVSVPPWRTRAVLNLCEADDPYVCEVHLHDPIPDAEPAPSLEWLRAKVDWIAEQRRAGRKTFVHCLNGVSRSALVITAYLMAEYSWTRDEALAFMRSKRPIVRPNPAFMSLLAEWERALQPARTGKAD
ncbi:MAG TPA: dual specificity protein phosphatase [Gemmataceae bacterium]|nr:dual specificity protein phosphatase [Gemmataceae bacterium]